MFTLPGGFQSGIESTFRVNVLPLYWVTKAFLPGMIVRERGHVVTIASAAGLLGVARQTDYSASKHAAIAFSLGTLGDLRRAGIKDIHISCVCPDGVWTPMVDVDDPDDALSFSGVMLMPEQVAEKVGGLLEKPKPVLAIPAWRGRFARFFDNHPTLNSLRLPAHDNSIIARRDDTTSPS